jgi:DNA invertase Pin-like site-specific DNA recombinase
VAEGKFVAYYRVSTAKQGASGLGLEAQEAVVLQYLNGGSWTLSGEFTEVESGKNSDPAQLALALNACRLIGATLVIAKLDRLTRNVAFLANLMEAGVEFVACDNPHATPFTIHLLAAVAEHEREQISKRTIAALQGRQGAWHGARGNRGGPPPNGRLGAATRRRMADAFASRVLPILRDLQSDGLSLNRMAAELNTRGIRTPMDSAWTATQVKRVLARTGL